MSRFASESMSHVQDLWWKKEKDPTTGKVKKVKTKRHGKGNRYRVRYVDDKGNDVSATFPDRRKGQAEEFLFEVESDKREGKYVDPDRGKAKIENYGKQCIESRDCDVKSRDLYLGRFRNQIEPYFRGSAVGSIDPSDIRKWLTGLSSKGLSENYRAALYELMNWIMSAAVDDKMIKNNPCAAKTVTRPSRKPAKVEVWEQSRLDSVVSGLSDRARIALWLAGGCGMRQGEILGFSPDDIDEKGMSINIVRQLRVVGRDLVFAPPKRNKERVVPLSDGILEKIKSHERECSPVKITLPWIKPDGKPVTHRVLISRQDGNLWSGDLFNKVVWQPAFKRAGLSYRKRKDGMHALRHVYASNLLAQGVSVKELSEYLGHADPAFTLRTYTHLIPSSHARARQAIDTMFRPVLRAVA